MSEWGTIIWQKNNAIKKIWRIFGHKTTRFLKLNSYKNMPFCISQNFCLTLEIVVLREAQS